MRTARWGLVAAALLGGCTVGSVDVPVGGGADAAGGDGVWTPITDPAAGAVQGTGFEVDGAGNIVAIVDNTVCRWDEAAHAWSPLAAPPPGVTIEHIRLRDGALFAMLDTPDGQQVCEYAAGAWQPRTLIGPTYAGGFSVHGSGNRVTAVIAEAGGRQLCECDLAGCTPRTPVAPISATDFDCDGCGAAAGTYFAQLGTQVCSASAGAGQWSPQTTEAPAALGPSVLAEAGEIHVEIGDRVCQFDGASMTFVDLTAELPDLIDFERGTGRRAGTWLGLADGVVCEYR